MRVMRAVLRVRGGARALLRRVLVSRGSPQLEPLAWPTGVALYGIGVRDAVVLGLGPRSTDGVIRMWYPAHAPSTLAPRRYFDGPDEQQIMTDGLAWLLSARGVRALGRWRTRGHSNAQPAGERLPVVFFSHGFTGFVGQNTHLCERLAAAGYLVISIAYPEAAASICAPDGSSHVMSAAQRHRLVGDQFARAMVRLLRARSIDAENQAISEVTAVDTLARENDGWSAYLAAMLDALVPVDQRRARVDAATAAILDAGDWSRVALMGMSFGGSTSANVAHLDERARAAINLDGMQQGAMLLGQDIRVPLLVMSSAGSVLPSGRVVNDLHYESRQAATGRVQRVLVADAGHYAFSDLVAFGAGRTRGLLDLGTVDPERMLTVVADTVTAFLVDALGPVGDPETDETEAS